MNVGTRFKRHPVLFALAIFIGAAITAANRLIFASALDRAVDLSEPNVLVVNSLLTSVPFLALAARKEARWLPWLVGLVPTIWLSWWWLQKGIAYQRSPDGSGVDMFGALVMLLSPFAIVAACLLMDEFLRQRAPS